MIEKLLSRLAHNAAQFFLRFHVFHGRMSRANFLYTQLFLIIVIVSLNLINTLLPTAIQSLSVPFLAIFSSPNEPLALIALYLLVIVISSAFLAPTVRRLHDTNRSGWHLFLSMFSPLFFISVYSMLSMTSAYRYKPALQTEDWLLTIVVFCMPLRLWFLTFFKKGDASKNRYGEPDE